MAVAGSVAVAVAVAVAEVRAVAGSVAEVRAVAGSVAGSVAEVGASGVMARKEEEIPFPPLFFFSITSSFNSLPCQRWKWEQAEKKALKIQKRKLKQKKRYKLRIISCMNFVYRL